MESKASSLMYVGQRIIVSSLAGSGGVSAMVGSLMIVTNTKFVVDGHTTYLYGQTLFENSQILLIPFFGGIALMFGAVFLGTRWVMAAAERHKNGDV